MVSYDIVKSYFHFLHTGTFVWEHCDAITKDIQVKQAKIGMEHTIKQTIPLYNDQWLEEQQDVWNAIHTAGTIMMESPNQYSNMIQTLQTVFNMQTKIIEFVKNLKENPAAFKPEQIMDFGKTWIDQFNRLGQIYELCKDIPNGNYISGHLEKCTQQSQDVLEQVKMVSASVEQLKYIINN